LAHETVRWMKNAAFDHTSHQLVACAECHTEAPSSQRTEDVLLPVIATCQKCHREGQNAAGTYCSECTRITIGPRPSPSAARILFLNSRREESYLLHSPIFSTRLFSPLINEIRDQRGPAGLMACTESRSVVAVEMLVEESVVAPMRIVLKFLHAAVDRPASGIIALENVDEPFRDFMRGASFKPKSLPKASSNLSKLSISR